RRSRSAPSPSRCARAPTRKSSPARSRGSSRWSNGTVRSPACRDSRKRRNTVREGGYNPGLVLSAPALPVSRGSARTMNPMRTASFLIVALMLGAASVHAQQPAPVGQLVDGIVAIVGDSAVLRSDLEEEALRIAAASGRALPDDPRELSQLYERALEARINELLLIQAAARDTLVEVTDEEIRNAVERQIADQRRALGGDVALSRALAESGLTLTQYREMLTEQFRRQAMIDR